MRKLHIICPNIEPEILKDFYLSKSISKIHRVNTLDALFTPDLQKYPLLKKYCSDNEKAPIELVLLENVYKDIALTHFAQINSYLNSRNFENDITFVPIINEDIERLKFLFEKSDLETEILDPTEKCSFSV